MAIFPWRKKQIDLNNSHLAHGGPADPDLDLNNRGAPIPPQPIGGQPSMGGRPIGKGAENYDFSTDPSATPVSTTPSYGGKIPPANFSDHTTVLGGSGPQADSPIGRIIHQPLGSGGTSDNYEMGGRPIGPKPPVEGTGPSAVPIQAEADLVESDQVLHKAPTVSLGGEGITINGLEKKPSSTMPDVSGGATNPLEQKPELLKPWGGHELTDDAMGLNPQPPGKPPA